MSPIDLGLNQILKYRSTTLWYSRLILPLNFVAAGAFQLQADYRYQSRFDEIDDPKRLPRDATARKPIHVVDARPL